MRLPILSIILLPVILAAASLPYELRIRVYAFDPKITYVIQTIDPESFQAFKNDPQQEFRTEIILNEIANGTFNPMHYPLLHQFRWFKPSIYNFAKTARDLKRNHAPLFVSQEESLISLFEQVFPSQKLMMMNDKFLVKFTLREELIDYIHQTLNETMRKEFDDIYDPNSFISFSLSNDIAFTTFLAPNLQSLYKKIQKLLVRNARGEISDMGMEKQINFEYHRMAETWIIEFDKNQGLFLKYSHQSNVKPGRIPFAISVDDENDAAEIVSVDSLRTYVLKFWMKFLAAQTSSNQEISASLIAKALEYGDSKIHVPGIALGYLGYTNVKRLLSLLRPRHLSEESLHTLRIIAMQRTKPESSIQAEKIMIKNWLDEYY